MPEYPVLSRAAVKAYDRLSVPVWVFSVDTLKISAANPAASKWLGHDARTLRSMSIVDLRPEAERASLVERVRRFDEAEGDAGVWTFVTRAGEHLMASVHWSKVMLDGAEAIVANILDISRLARAENRAQALDSDLEAMRRNVVLSGEHLARLFEGLPGKMLVVTPRDHVVVAVTDDYLRSVKLEREAMLGRYLFDVLPDDPDEPTADGSGNLKISLQRVEALRVTDVMNLQRYPVRGPEGGFEERFWLVQNKPVFDTAGTLTHIIHRVEDATGLVTGTAQFDSAASSGRESEITQPLVEARLALLALQERETRLRTAERLLDLGAWEFDLKGGELIWSKRVFDIYGVPDDHGAPNFNGYVALVHPDDRAQMLETYTTFHDSRLPEFTFQHRIIRNDGTVGHIRGVGARHRADDRDVVIGFVQDVTAVNEASERLKEASRLQKVAGFMARLGSWRVDLESGRVTWSPETAAIHGEPEGTSPVLENAISYYEPEYRDRIRDKFAACAELGRSFDEIMQIRTAKGQRVWVRAIGEALRDDTGRIVAVEGAFQDISELVAARDASEELSRRLRQTLDGISDAFVLLGYDWNISFVNAQAERLLRRGRDELLGKNAWAEFPEAFGTRVQTEFERAVATGSAVSLQNHYPPLGKWFEIDADPTPEGLAVYFRDISAQRGRDEQLRLLEAAVSRQNDILLITEAEPIDAPHGPRIVYVNDAFVRRTGYSRDEVIGQTPRILQGPKTQRDELDRIRDSMRAWKPVRAELINYTRSGEEFWLEVDIVPLADASGWFTHWVAIERDITERKAAERDLKVNEERFRLVARAAGNAVWDWDIENDRQWWSDGLREIFGHEPDPEQKLPTIWRDHVHPEDLRRIDAALGRLLDGQSDSFHEQYRFRRADGSWAHVEDTAFALRNGDGKASRILGAMTDIAERRDLEDRLRHAQKMEAVGQLTGGVSHDFNNLLTIMLGNAEILSERLEQQPDLQRLAEMIVSAADRGAELTNRLLAFSRKQPLAPRVVDVSQLIQDMDGLFRRALPENIEIEVIRYGGLWKTELDPGQFESALLNLVVNARDAMPQGGKLTIEIANAALDDDYVAKEMDVKAGQYVQIVVSDTGHGIAPDLIGRIFEPFFTTKEAGKGSGMGLSMVFGFVKQSGGHIRVYSEPHEGTTFRLYFPRSLAKTERQRVPGESRRVVGGDATILVVEDDDLVRAHVVSQLLELGYRVHEASDGATALEIMNRVAGIDLLFTDVVMPGGMGGRALADAAVALQPGLKLLFTSGYTENSIVHHGRLDPGVELLSKPYRRDQLAAKIRRVLGQS